jgi:hypothetical protein
MTSPETLHMKNPVDELRFPLVTHTAYYDTRLGSYGLLNSIYGADQILNRLGIKVTDQVLGREKHETCWALNTSSEANMVHFRTPTHRQDFGNHSNGYGLLNTANMWSTTDR